MRKSDGRRDTPHQTDQPREPTDSRAGAQPTKADDQSDNLAR